MRKRGLFYTPPKSKYWSGIISIENAGAAEYAVGKLSEGWRSISRAEKRKRIKYAVLAMNRAKAMLKRRNLSQRERSQLKKVIEIYSKWVEKHKLRR